ncbi:glutaredoxin family protein [Halobacillus yeomjeoni]|uniref:Glutaredoxin family protein n=1 Tax=Halobacillus yeomjeoni TaxID=311194 RepID=A0A931HXL9_9BACI|nr:glutaredoxin family protein [Halobacillus yeomjeoni]MBH0231575.1 glutaredoxin family protein [Halobacillus yeomjeoni]
MSNPKVVVYTSDDCTNCDRVITKLSEWEVEFEERNITRNREYFKELQSKKVYGTPATFIDEEKVLGFQERKLKRTLGIQYEDRFLNTDAMNFS